MRCGFMEETETIVAPGTPVGESALAALRVSGPLAPALLAGMDGVPPAGLPPRRATRVHYRTSDGRVIDDLLAIRYAKPASYTGDDVLELFPHGNPFIVDSILKDLLRRGCRMAEPGEFTRRAFLNGKMDLTQAEAVMDLIRARSGRAAEAARQQLDGRLGSTINQLINNILQISAEVEAYIDFPEEDLPPEDAEGPLRKLRTVIGEIDGLVASEEYRSRLHDGVRIAVLGATNAGKSSLLNALVADDRAIVSETPGTTRDFLEVHIRLGPYPAVVVDTAGLRESRDAVESEGIARSLRQAERADAVLLVRDGALPSPALHPALAPVLERTPALVLENKGDLPAWRSDPAWWPALRRLRVSAVSGEGLHELRDTLVGMLETGVVVPPRDAVLVSARHSAALRRARESLRSAVAKAGEGLGLELMASDLRDAVDAFGEIIGNIDNERMLDRLFASFCIGK